MHSMVFHQYLTVHEKNQVSALWLVSTRSCWCFKLLAPEEAFDLKDENADPLLFGGEFDFLRKGDGSAENTIKGELGVIGAIVKAAFATVEFESFEEGGGEGTFEEFATGE